MLGIAIFMTFFFVRHIKIKGKEASIPNLVTEF